MSSHNPVPFDFVPFGAQAPEVRKLEDWENEGELLSGRIDYTITPLTPVHIVGKQVSKGNQDNIQITKSYFSRSGSSPAIPGSSVKGMLRAFFEALTNSWVGQASKEYPATNKERHIGFFAYGSIPDADITGTPAIPERLHPQIKDGRIDLASFLFGMVPEGNGDDNAFRSRLIFEDIPVASRMLDDNILQLPDVRGTAFMGGPKPRKNNWWYFKPHSIRKRSVMTPGGRKTVADFIGAEFWGRKFYYHQNPAKVLRWYDNEKNWPHTAKKRGQWTKNYYTYPVEAISEGVSLNGSIYFERIPEPLLELIVFTLQPGNDIKHKLGYGKAFGLGSIDINLKSVTANPASGFMADLPSISIKPDSVNPLSYVQENSLIWLRLILKYDALIFEPNCVFTYPRFDKDFRKVVDWNKHFSKAEDTFKVTIQSAEKMAVSLFKEKSTIHFRLYQETSEIWDKILKRVS